MRAIDNDHLNAELRMNERSKRMQTIATNADQIKSIVNSAFTGISSTSC